MPPQPFLAQPSFLARRKLANQHTFQDGQESMSQSKSLSWRCALLPLGFPRRLDDVMIIVYMNAMNYMQFFHHPLGQSIVALARYRIHPLSKLLKKKRRRRRLLCCCWQQHFLKEKKSEWRKRLEEKKKFSLLLPRCLPARCHPLLLLFFQPECR